MKCPFLLFCILLSFFVAKAQHKTSSYFHAEKTIAHPVKIPVSILKQLYREEMGDENAVIDTTEFPYAKGTAAASFVQLGNGQNDAMLVQGNDGANTTGFWIFLKRGKNWKLILADRGLDLRLKKLPRSGIREVEVASCHVYGCYHRFYKFDGKRYYPYRCYEETDKGIRIYPCKDELLGH